MYVEREFQSLRELETVGYYVECNGGNGKQLEYKEEIGGNGRQLETSGGSKKQLDEMKRLSEAMEAI